MRENPFQSPTTESLALQPDARQGTGRAVIVAILQKGLLGCILVQLLGLAVTAALFTSVVPGATPNRAFSEWMQFMMLINLAASLAALLAAMLTVALAIYVSNVFVGLLLGVFSLVPIFGLLALLIINQRATKYLKAKGYSVGLFGVPFRQLGG